MEERRDSVFSDMEKLPRHFFLKCGLHLKLKSGCEVLLLFSEVEQVLFKKKIKNDRNIFRGQAAALTAFCLHVDDCRKKKKKVS